jgi:hypothetical protein
MQKEVTKNDVQKSERNIFLERLAPSDLVLQHKLKIGTRSNIDSLFFVVVVHELFAFHLSLATHQAMANTQC